ncbi:hypothetical protein CAPTEDRAFT_211981 [Capitella teleta]|uniref:Uncharacterized protein n=1 Tax=Capitella teleta TaxID=283909 RepID=R7T3R6_CAPTE|nr:hypothetical protein CAPTEDRAFT_211981 [Capitella teleta]|eukprot:ELT87383.1 hypothetical protein CAPTEDRAFT_211981 [Capitella teleta]
MASVQKKIVIFVWLKGIKREGPWKCLRIKDDDNATELADEHDGDCLLREEDTQLMITRTALYTAIHRIIRRKAGERMHLTEAEVEESLLRPLYQFAFEAHRKNETVVREKDSKKVENFQHICQVGYLTKELLMSRLQEELLRLLAELNVVPPELADVICKRRPPLIKIHDDCSVSCMKGMLKLCNLRFQPPIRLNVDLGNSRDEEEKMSFVQELIESKNIECSQIWIHPRNDTHLWNIVSGLRLGQADSVQQQLHIDFDEDVSVAECSLRELFEAIAGCHRLQILSFNRLEMGDSVVPSVCKMIESLKQLREFTSMLQMDESLTEEGFKQLEPIIKRNGLFIYMN